MDFLLAKANLPFTIALGLMLGIGIVEFAGVMFGLGFASAFDALFPDLDVDFTVGDVGGDIDAGLDGDFDATASPAPEGVWRILAWLHVGRVPIIVLLLLLLTAFGLIGLGLQAISAKLLGFLWPAWVAWLPAFLLAMPVVRFGGRVMVKVLPRDETDAVSDRSFIGRVATITLGTAQAGRPAQAKLRDQHGQTHYIMVEPDNDDEQFHAGASILLVSKRGACFRAIANTSQALQDD